jgi:hypothetical protein
MNYSNVNHPLSNKAAVIVDACSDAKEMREDNSGWSIAFEPMPSWDSVLQTARARPHVEPELVFKS